MSTGSYMHDRPLATASNPRRRDRPTGKVCPVHEWRPWDESWPDMD